MNPCNSTDTSDGVVVPTGTETPSGMSDVIAVLKGMGEQREYLIRVILAVYASTYLEKKNPLWVLLIGRPSSNKTTTVDLLKDLEDTYKLDNLTGNPFSSGQKESDNPQDLLPLLNGKCFIMKELGTILSRSDEFVKQFIGELIAIYDGNYSKHSPTRGTKRYESYFSHIACVTPQALEERQRYMSQVGPRYLFLRLPALNIEEKEFGFQRIWEGQDAECLENARRVVTRFCLNLKGKLQSQPVKVYFSEEVKMHLNRMSELLASARGVFYTDRFEKELQDRGFQKEEPFRALQQLKKLAEALAIVDGRSVVETSDLKLVRMIVFSSMSTQRSEILDLFSAHLSLTVSDASLALKDRCKKTCRRQLDDLVKLEVLVVSKEQNDRAQQYSIHPRFLSIMFLNSNELPSEN
jgi:hypothetical protein